MDPEARKVVELGYGGSERLTMNMGPQHPSAHGVFRAILSLELLVAAVEIADDRVDAHHRLALEREDRAEDAVGGRVLRPHVHGEALAAPVTQLDDFSRFGIHVRSGVSSALSAAARTARE